MITFRHLRSADGRRASSVKAGAVAILLYAAGAVFDVASANPPSLAANQPDQVAPAGQATDSVGATPLADAVGPPAETGDDPMALVETYIANRPGKTGLYSLETGAEALRARAWLVDNARRSIEVQYFIWSPDNIGTLAAEALLRAADRGVKVRVIVDDLLIDAQERTLVSLVHHPNVEVRIYNPRHSVGVRWYQRVWHMLTDFRSFNQRMHDKSVIIDGKVAIIGGRNMAVEYYDFSHQYNFRDRDALVLGKVVAQIQANFESFWASSLSKPVATLIQAATDLGRLPMLSEEDVAHFRADLSRYAASPENFEPEIRDAIAGTPGEFIRLARAIRWGEVRFIHDMPGKNTAGRFELNAGSTSAKALAELVSAAQREVLIQSPYLVLSDQAFDLFEKALARGVRIRINTNSLAATDNLEAFSGYLWQRDRLLSMGVEVREFRPDAQVQYELMRRYRSGDQVPPIMSLHAKTLVVDGETVFIGTYNLDPRSQNLNTEIGIIMTDQRFADGIREAILKDMAPGNSWDPITDSPDAKAVFKKRLKARVFSWLPLDAIL